MVDPVRRLAYLETMHALHTKPVTPTMHRQLCEAIDLLRSADVGACLVDSARLSDALAILWPLASKWAWACKEAEESVRLGEGAG